MDRHAAQVNAIDKSPAFKTLEVVVGFFFHLNVQYLNTIKAHFSGLVDTVLNRQLQVSFESPEGICRDGNRIRPMRVFSFVGRSGSPVCAASLAG